MGLFSRRSKSVRKEEVPASVKKESNARPQSSHGQAPAKQQTMAQKSRSVPTSRRTSFSSRDPGFTSHPAYAQNNIIPVNSAAQSYLPVPQLPESKKRDRAASTKAAKVLGVKAIPSAPASPLLSPQRDSASDSDKQAGSRHDSVNSNVDAPRIGKLGSEQTQMSFAEEMAMEPAFSDEMDTAQKRRSISSIGYRHSRDMSHDSFRPSNNRRHTLHQAPAGFSLSRQDSQRESISRGRSHQSIPSYSMPTNASRAYVQAEHERHASRRSEVSIMAPFAGAYQPRASSVSREQIAASSPTLRPHRHTVYAEDAMSIRSYTQPPPMTRQSLHRQSSMVGPPPLSILDGLKVNRRGKILDEEGEMIGELVDGDIIDCVRQKANAYGEVIDEYGRVVGRVQTLHGGMGIASPSIHMGSPALGPERGGDYFSIHQSSPALNPVMDAQAMQRRIQEDGQQKYRMLMDIPPVPSMPAHYQPATNSPALTAKRHTLATFDQFDGVHCVELPAHEVPEPTDNDVPVFDLSEPFMPKHRRMKTPPSVEAPVKSSPTVVSPRQLKRMSTPAQAEIKVPVAAPVAAAAPSISPVPSSSVSSASETPVSSNASSISAPSSQASSASVASTQDDDEDDDDDEDCFEDAVGHAQPVLPVASEPVVDAPKPAPQAPVKAVVQAKPQQVAAPAPAPAPVAEPEDEESEPELEMIGRAIEQPAPVQTYRPSQPVPEHQQIRPVRHGVSMHPRVIVPVSQLTQQTITEDAAESPVQRPITAVEITRPALSSRARTAPSPATSTSITAIPPMPRPDTMSEITASATTSGYNSAEESLSEAESIEVKRKEVRISNLPPTTIPNRGLTRSMSDGAGLRMTAMPSMPSVPESAPLPDTPRKSMLLSPSDAMPRPFGMRNLGSRNAAPLPQFPRGNFSGLPSNPFAAANAANNNGAGLQKRNTMPARPGMPPPLPRSALARGHKFGLNAPLIPSPLADHRKTMSSMTTSTVSSEESTPFGSDAGRDGLKSDAVSIISTMSGSAGKTRTYFTHTGRVTVEAGDLPPSALAKKDEVVVAVTERPDTAGSKTDSLKKRRFSLGFRKNKSAPVVAAH